MFYGDGDLLRHFLNPKGIFDSSCKILRTFKGLVRSGMGQPLLPHQRGGDPSEDPQCPWIRQSLSQELKQASLAPKIKMEDFTLIQILTAHSLLVPMKYLEILIFFKFLRTSINKWKQWQRLYLM